MSYTITVRGAGTEHTDLRCDETFAATPPNVEEYTYTVSLLCFDLNRSGGVEAGDISAWMDQPVDLDRDSAVDAADLGLVVEAVLAAP